MIAVVRRGDLLFGIANDLPYAKSIDILDLLTPEMAGDVDGPKPRAIPFDLIRRSAIIRLVLLRAAITGLRESIEGRVDACLLYTSDAADE